MPAPKSHPWRDAGLCEAIRAVGGISKLARRLGISQPSVSNWTHVPTDRITAVEAISGIPRAALRPDLFGKRTDLDDEAHGSTPRMKHGMLSAGLAKSRGTKPDEADVIKQSPSMRIVGLAGWSGSGKTTLIKKLIPRLVAGGIKVSTLKHAHHGFDLDQPGKDSFFHRAAGATEVIISSAKRWAILHELREEAEWDLPALVAKMSPVDLVLVEGFKRDAIPKLEIYRAANDKPLIHPDDTHIVAIASDVSLPQATIPVVDLNDIEAIAALLLKRAVPVGAANAIAAIRRG